METLLFKIEVQGLSDQVREIGRLKLELEKLVQSKKELKQEYTDGKISLDKYQRATGELELKIKASREQSKELEKATYATATAFKGAEGSMVRLSQELSHNRDLYRSLSQAERENDQIGGKLLRTIQQQDTEIKKLDASIGNHQRNVGHYEKALAGLQGTLTSLPGGLGQIATGLMGVTSAIGKASAATGAMNKTMTLGAAALGGVVLAGGALVGFLKSATDEAMKEEKANGRLLYALNGNVEAYDRMTQLKKKLLDTTTFSKDQINETINYALSLGRTEEQTQKLITAAMGLSKVTGKDLQTSMTMVAATYEGSIRGLNRYVGEVKGMTVEQLKSGAAVDAINEKLGKFATTGLTSTGGMLAQASKYFMEIKEIIGFAVLPVVNDFAKSFLNLVSGIKDYIKEPMSETLEKEHNDVLRLVGSVTSLNEKSDLRKKLLDELITKYPSLFGNLDKEKTKNEDLAKMIGTVNEAYEKRIKLAVYGEDLAKVEKEGAEIFKSQRDNLAQIDQLYSKYITNANKEASVTEKIAALKNVTITREELLDAETGARINRQVQGVSEILALESQYYTLQGKQLYNQRKSLEILGEQQKLQDKTTPTKTTAGGRDSDGSTKGSTNAIEAMASNLKQNSDYILKLSQELLDAEITATAQSAEKEKEIVKNKYEDKRQTLLKEQKERIEAIDLEIKQATAKGKALTEDQKKYLKQKEAITEATSKLITANEKAEKQELKQIDDKYYSQSFEAQKKAITDEATMKTNLVTQYYSQFGTLTKEQETAKANEIIKIQLESYQKQFEALKKSIDDKKKLNQPANDQELTDVASLYLKIRELQDALAAKTEKKAEETKEGKGGVITKGLASLFSIPDDEAGRLLGEVSNFLNQVGNLYIQAQQQRISAELEADKKKLDKQKTQELKELDLKRKKGLITEAKYEEEKEKIDTKYEAAKLQLQKEAFEKNKKLQIASALMSGAGAVINALNTQPFWLGIVMAALASILVGIQVANIKKQEFTGAKGGLIEGASHAEGGVTFTSRQSNIELEGGEGVINKRTMQSKDVISVTGTPRQIASQINSMNGYGVAFSRGGVVVPRWASGGITPAPPPVSFGMSSSDMDRFARTIIDGITYGVAKNVNDKKVYVVETDITETQNRVKVIESGSRW